MSAADLSHTFPFIVSGEPSAVGASTIQGAALQWALSRCRPEVIDGRTFIGELTYSRVCPKPVARR